MGLPFVRVEYNDAINYKKDILASELGILNITKKIGNWKKLRKQEFSSKTTFKRAIRHNIASINALMREMPEIENSEISYLKEKRESKTQTLKSRSIEQELKQIREKLNQLNS